MIRSTKRTVQDVIISDILHLDQWDSARYGTYRTDKGLLIRYAAALMPQTDFVLCKGTLFHPRKNFKINCTEYFYNRTDHTITLGEAARVGLDSVKIAAATVGKNEWISLNLFYGDNLEYLVEMTFQP